MSVCDPLVLVRVRGSTGRMVASVDLGGWVGVCSAALCCAVRALSFLGPKSSGGSRKANWFFVSEVLRGKDRYVRILTSLFRGRVFSCRFAGVQRLDLVVRFRWY